MTGRTTTGRARRARPGQIMFTCTLPPFLSVDHLNTYRARHRVRTGIPAHPRLTMDDTRTWHAHSQAWEQQWLPTGDLTPADAAATHDIIDTLATGLRAHAWIITPLALTDLITFAREMLQDYLTECGLTPIPADAFEVAVAHDFGGANPDTLESLLRQYRVRDLPGAHPDFAALQRRASDLARRAQRSTPPSTPQPTLGYGGWIDPLLIVNPCRTDDEWTHLYGTVNDCYKNHLEGGEDDDHLATFTAGQSRALQAWSRTTDRLCLEATQLLGELRALTDRCEQDRSPSC